MDITLNDEPTRLTAVVRSTVRTDEMAAFYDSAYERVVTAIAGAGGQIAGPAIGWYHGMPSDTVDVAAGFPVAGLAAGALTDGVQVLEIPGGRAVVALYVGAYEGLPGAWEQLERWRAEHAGDGRGDYWEEYVTEPTPDGDPALNQTRIVLPLA